MPFRLSPRPRLSPEAPRAAAAISATLAIGLVGGLAATWIGAPLPMLLGALVAVAAATLSGLTVRARPLGVPEPARRCFIPIIGVAIGSAFSPEILSQAPGWWPTLLALLVYLPLAHGAGFLLYRRSPGMDVATAYYASVPGGLLDAIQMGEEAGANMRRLITLQFLRLILCILCVPLAFMAVTGHAVGSAAGAHLGDGAGGMGVLDLLILVAAGALGGWGGRRISLPAGLITGPILLSGAAHLAGLTQAAPPDWLIALTQWVIGASLGARFAGLTMREFGRDVRMAFLNMAATLSFALLAAVLLSGAAGQQPEAVILAYAPGGLAEMSLIAVSMQISVVYVMAHHVTRLMLAVAMARALRSRIAPALPKD